MHLLKWHSSSQNRHTQPISIKHNVLAVLLLSLCLALITLLYGEPVRAESNETTAVNATFGLEYAVPNGPLNLVEEAPGRIWYTSPSAGGIGLLAVTSLPDDPIVRYRTQFFGFGENSQPHDLVFSDGFVWFTLRGIRALGKIDVATFEIQTFTLKSVGAAPTGIDVDPAGRLWIAQNNGRISRFDPTTEEFIEFTLPDTLSQTPRIEDIIYQDTRNVWFTMPDANRVVIYDSVRDQFSDFATGELAPTGLTLDPDGRLWVTAYGSSLIGRFTPTTLSIWIWYDTPNPESGPAGVLAFEDEFGVLQVWLTESKLGTIGRLQIANNFDLTNTEAIGPNEETSSTWGIIRGSDEHIWVADTGNNLIYELTAPYIHRVYMATLANGPAIGN